MVGVTDAKDVYDRLTMDTGFGVQKIPGLHCGCAATTAEEAENELQVDCYRQLLRLTLMKGEWSIEFKEGFTKQTKKGKANYEEENLTELPGRVPDGRDEALLKYVFPIAEQPGWHFIDGVGVSVAHGAKSYRSPAPRLTLQDFPYRTTVAGWKGHGTVQWRILEEKVALRDLPNHQEHVGGRCSLLVTFFSGSGPSAT